MFFFNGDFFTSRRKITIDGTMVKTLTDIPLTLFVNLPGVKSDGGDIRLSTLDGTPIPREIEWCWSTTNNVVLHYQVDTVDSTSQSFYVYWGNSALSEPAADSTYGSQAVWSNGYEAVYHMNIDPSTSDLIDSTANGYNGTMNGSMTSEDLVDATYCKAIEFDGVDDFFSIPNRIIPSNVATVESRYTVLNSDGAHLINYAFWNGSISSGYFFEGIQEMLVHGYPDSWALSASSSYPGARNDYYIWEEVNRFGQTLYHADTFAGNSYGKFYRNGTYVGTDSFGYSSWGSSSYYAFRIGASKQYNVNSGSMYYSNAQIEEVRFSSVERSADFIITTHNTLNNPTDTGTNPFYSSIGPVEHGRRKHIMFM